jgi:hypothetical protein
MHFAPLLLLLLGVATSQVAARAECKPFPEKDAAGKWSMQFYKKKNCEDKLGRIDATMSKYKPNKCYKLPKGIRSIHGSADGKYVLKWFMDKECGGEMDTFDFLMASYQGKYLEAPELKAEIKKDIASWNHPPQSFIVLNNYKKPAMFYPQYMNCRPKDDAKSEREDYEKGDSMTKKACSEVLKKCGDRCPKSMLKSLINFSDLGPSCLMLNKQMYNWFSALCKKEKGYQCARYVYKSGSPDGLEFYSVPCNFPQPPEEIETDKDTGALIANIGRLWNE